MSRKKLYAVLICLLVVGSVCAQGFPWGDFKRRTMKELIKINNDDSAEDFKRVTHPNGLIVRGNVLPSVVRVTFTGEERSMGKTRKKFIELWGTALSHKKEYQDRYQREFLFKEDADEYWLPVQEPVIKYFEKELKTGEFVDLYLVRPGGIKTGDNVDWVFLVEEFQKPK